MRKGVKTKRLNKLEVPKRILSQNNIITDRIYCNDGFWTEDRILEKLMIITKSELLYVLKNHFTLSIDTMEYENHKGIYYHVLNYDDTIEKVVIWDDYFEREVSYSVKYLGSGVWSYK